MPDFLALSGDAETKAAAKTIAQVLWDDLDFEREFYMIPRDTYGVDSAGALGRPTCPSIAGASWAPTAW